MVPLNLTCLHCLQHFFFRDLFNLYYLVIVKHKVAVVHLCPIGSPRAVLLIERLPVVIGRHTNVVRAGGLVPGWKGDLHKDHAAVCLAQPSGSQIKTLLMTYPSKTDLFGVFACP